MPSHVLVQLFENWWLYKLYIIYNVYTSVVSFNIFDATFKRLQLLQVRSLYTLVIVKSRWVNERHYIICLPRRVFNSNMYNMYIYFNQLFRCILYIYYIYYMYIYTLYNYYKTGVSKRLDDSIIGQRIETKIEKKNTFYYEDVLLEITFIRRSVHILWPIRSVLNVCFFLETCWKTMAYWWLLQSAMWYTAIMVLANPLMPTIITEVLPKLPLLIIRRLGTIPIESIWTEPAPKTMSSPPTRRRTARQEVGPDGLLTGLFPMACRWRSDAVVVRRSPTERQCPIDDDQTRPEYEKYTIIIMKINKVR